MNQILFFFCVRFNIVVPYELFPTIWWDSEFEKHTCTASPSTFISTILLHLLFIYKTNAKSHIFVENLSEYFFSFLFGFYYTQIGNVIHCGNFSFEEKNLTIFFLNLATKTIPNWKITNLYTSINIHISIIRILYLFLNLVGLNIKIYQNTHWHIWTRKLWP